MAHLQPFSLSLAWLLASGPTEISGRSLTQQRHLYQSGPLSGILIKYYDSLQSEQESDNYHSHPNSHQKYMQSYCNELQQLSQKLLRQSDFSQSRDLLVTLLKQSEIQTIAA